MSLGNWKKRLGLERQTPSGSFVAPNFALDIEPSFVAAARLNLSARQVQSVGAHELPAGSLVPSANKANMSDGASVRRAIAGAVERAGNGGGRVGLLIPDVAARVALLQFETLPDSQGEAESLVLWRMREFMPYAPEEARISYQILTKQPGSVEVLVVAVRGSVFAEYEAMVESINGGPVLVLPATLPLLPLLPEDPAGQLLLHFSPGALTAVVVASNRVRYWRTRPLEGDSASTLEEVSREATRVLATCQDNLGVQVQNVWFCARPPASREVEDALAQAVGRELRPLPGNFVPKSGLPSGQRETFERFGMPFAGLVANQSERR